MTVGLIIYCTQELRDRWPVSLARLWRNDYPNLFDDDDVRLSRLQTRNHFNEWFAAIYVFHSRGLLSLIEKYRRSHPRKKPIFERLLSFDQRQLLTRSAPRVACSRPTSSFTRRIVVGFRVDAAGARIP